MTSRSAAARSTRSTSRRELRPRACHRLWRSGAAGHDVIVYGVPGPLASDIESRGLTFVPAHSPQYRPAPTRVTELARLARRERIDSSMPTNGGPVSRRVAGPASCTVRATFCTVLSMSLMPFAPASAPLIKGTEQLGSEARRAHRGKVWVIEPSIDTDQDHPGIDGSAFRRQHGLVAGELPVLSVSRLASTSSSTPRSSDRCSGAARHALPDQARPGRRRPGRGGSFGTGAGRRRALRP